MKRVLEGASWTFDNHLLLLHQLKEGEVHCSISSKKRNYMRIRVLIDVSLTLKRWKKICRSHSNQFCGKLFQVQDGKVRKKKKAWLRTVTGRPIEKDNNKWWRDTDINSRERRARVVQEELFGLEELGLHLLYDRKKRRVGLGYVLSRKPDVIFLSETRVDSSIIESIRGEIKFDGSFAVDKLGGGGLAGFWKGLRPVTLIGYSQNHVDLEVIKDLLRLKDKRGDNPHPCPCYKALEML
ncbi:hypothetical protein POTOM_025857 [Populus tomentosa]|uniref:Uncharacterized protein n=1 Tax=Populus tomentosa TaxID=118781 RepID=A0A8X7ZW42_POPTO|nr:hypothetical protein POTOM_025857 [Populus tomentosa]